VSVTTDFHIFSNTGIYFFEKILQKLGQERKVLATFNRNNVINAVFIKKNS